MHVKCEAALERSWSKSLNYLTRPVITLDSHAAMATLGKQIYFVYSLEA